MHRIEADLTVTWPLQIIFTDRVFAPANRSLRDVLTPPEGQGRAKALVVTDAAIAAADHRFLSEVLDYFDSHSTALQLVAPPVGIEGGESIKNSSAALDHIQTLIERYHLDRHSYLIAVGGGALLDVAGFAAATAHRGVRHVRIPSTTLSQCDSGVGVKNGINAFGKKNFIGAFAPPWAVLIDCCLLDLLPLEHKRGGYSEAVKVACIRDAAFFRSLEADAPLLAEFDPAAMRRLVHRSAELHFRHIVSGGDPFERGSQRPLDFGHWVAHKLEQTSGFQLHHGHCVAIGIAVDVLYSCRAGFLAPEAEERILSLLEALGFELFVPELLQVDAHGRSLLLEGLEEFREHLGGQLCITLVNEIGRGFETHEMNYDVIEDVLSELQARATLRQPAACMS